MERLNRTLRLARIRGDRVAILNCEARIAAMWRASLIRKVARVYDVPVSMIVSESELRLMDGNR